MKLIQVKYKFSFFIFIDLDIWIGFTLRPSMMSGKIIVLHLDKWKKVNDTIDLYTFYEYNNTNGSV